MVERKEAVTLHGNPMTLIGKEIKAGDKSPDFMVLNQELKEVSSTEFSDKIKVIVSVPSLDTPVCDLEIKRFNEEAIRLSDDVVIISISMDLPFAQKRFCQANSIENVKVFSDYRDHDFANKFGVLIKELGLLSRAVFVIDKEDKVRYIEIIKEISDSPNYGDLLQALKVIL